MIARRLYDTGRMSRRDFQPWLSRLTVGPKPPKKGGGNYYATKKLQLGMPYISTVFEALSDRRLTLAGAARAFLMKPLYVERFRKHVAASDES